VKKNKLNIIISLSLLALMLVGRVGIHIFHHHSSSVSLESSTIKKVPQGIPYLTEAGIDDADCPLCQLDAFHEIALATFFSFSFLLIFGKSLYHILISELERFSFFTKGRGPPFFASIA
jgi:hypothetical protein